MLISKNYANLNQAALNCNLSEDAKLRETMIDFMSVSKLVFERLAYTVNKTKAEPLHVTVVKCLNNAESLTGALDSGVAIANKINELVGETTGTRLFFGLKRIEDSTLKELIKFRNLKLLLRNARTLIESSKMSLHRDIDIQFRHMNHPAKAVTQVLRFYAKFSGSYCNQFRNVNTEELHRRCGKKYFHEHCDALSLSDYMDAKLRLDVTHASLERMLPTHY